MDDFPCTKCCQDVQKQNSFEDSNKENLIYEKIENKVIEKNIDEETPLVSYEEMENQGMNDSESTKDLDILAKSSTSHESMIDGYKDLECTFCSKTFKYRNCLLRHINRIHKDKVTNYQQKFTVGFLIDELKEKHDINILEIGDTLNRQTGYIHQNADNILELLNTQNQHNDQIKKITDFLFSSSSTELSKKVFGCKLCSKNFSSKKSLYSHKNRFHKRDSREKVFKCEKCYDIFEHETDLAIHNYRFHRSSL